MKSARFNQSFLFPMAFALLGALFLPSGSGSWVRSALTTLVSPVSRTVRGVAETINGRVSSPRQSLSQQQGGGKTYEQLQNELETLKSQFAVLENENRRLQMTLDERKDWPKDLQKLCKVVRVIGGDAGTQQALTLQPGGLENPLPDAAVLNGYDIVGRLRIVGPGTTRAMLLTDRSIVARGEFVRYIPDGQGFTRLKLFADFTGDGYGRLVASVKLADFVQGPEKKLRIEVGDRVLLSDSNWPATVQNFCLGEIESYDSSSRPLFCKIIVRPRRDMMKLKEVMVLKGD